MSEDVAKVKKRKNQHTDKTHCKRNHPLSGENLGINGSQRYCKICFKVSQKKYNDKKSQERARIKPLWLGAQPEIKVLLAPKSNDCFFVKSPFGNTQKVISSQKKNIRVARKAYTMAFGPIKGNLKVHHICGNNACINPDHLILKNRKEATICPNGHDWTGENLLINKRGVKVCKSCQREADAKSYEKKKVKRQQAALNRKKNAS